MPTVHLPDRARFTVTGDDATHFLQSLITTDLDHMGDAEWKPGALLTAQGKVQFAFLVARQGQGFALEAATADAAALAKRLGFYKLRSKVMISVPEPVVVAVGWGGVEPLVEPALADSRLGGIPVWRAALPGPVTGDLDEWNRLRISYGVAEPGADYVPGDVFAHDINLDQTGGLSFKKGCYVGQEVVSRMHHRNTARRRVMVAEGAAALETGAQVFTGNKPAGLIGTVAGHFGLALVRLDRVRDALEAGELLRAGEVPVTVSFPKGATFSWPLGSEASE